MKILTLAALIPAYLPFSLLAQENVKPDEIIQVHGAEQELVLPSEEPIEGIFGSADTLREIPVPPRLSLSR